MTLFKKYVDKNLEKHLQTLDSKFHRCTYSDCIDLLKNSNKNFEFKPQWGKDLKQNMKGLLQMIILMALFLSLIGLKKSNLFI